MPVEFSFRVHFWTARRCLFFRWPVAGPSFFAPEKTAGVAQHRPVEAVRLGAAHVVSFFFSQASLAGAVVFLGDHGAPKENSLPKKKDTMKTKRKKFWGGANVGAHMSACLWSHSLPFFHSKAIGRAPSLCHSVRRHCAGVEGRLTHKKKKKARLLFQPFPFFFFFWKQKKGTHGWRPCRPRSSRPLYVPSPTIATFWRVSARRVCFRSARAPTYWSANVVGATRSLRRRGVSRPTPSTIFGARAKWPSTRRPSTPRRLPAAPTMCAGCTSARTRRIAPASWAERSRAARESLTPRSGRARRGPSPISSPNVTASPCTPLPRPRDWAAPIYCACSTRRRPTAI